MEQKPTGPKGWHPIVKISLAAVFAVAVLSALGDKDDPAAKKPPVKNVPYTELIKQIKSGQINKVETRGREIIGSGPDIPYAKSYLPENENIVERTDGTGVTIEEIEPPPAPKPSFSQRNPVLTQMLILLAVIIGGGLLLSAIAKRQNGGKGGIFGAGKSKAKMTEAGENKVTFADVAGVDEAREDLEEIVDFLKNPNKFKRLGGKMPTGVLMVGPPGTGKTLTARAVAGEAKVPFFTISGSDFVEMYVGVGASRVRSMFEEAKKNAPCIIFIDEIDAVGKKRGSGGNGGNDEREQTLNQLLVEMDGFEENLGVVIIGATNTPESLDAALLRPGRFDRQVTLNLPDISGREMILKVHTKKIPLAGDVDLQVVARGTPGFSGAELANLANEAALRATKLNKLKVSMDDIEWAKDKVFMGPERRTMIMKKEEIANTAYHEAGHVIVTITEKDYLDPLHKVTIIPRGRALGVTWSLPQDDRVSHSIASLNAQIANLFGGREAEQAKFGASNVTTGASNDIQRATDIANRMVKEWGMSDKVGPRRFMSNEQQSFLGAVGGQAVSVSQDLQRIIDDEISYILKKGQERARQIIQERNVDFVNIAEALIKYETLSGADVQAIVNGEDIDARKAQERQATINNTVVAPPVNQANDNVEPEDEIRPFKAHDNNGPKI